MSISKVVAVTTILLAAGAAVFAASEYQGRGSIRNLDYVILLCEDVDKMKTFYTETMGFEVHRELPGWIDLKVGSSLLTIRQRGRAYDGPSNPSEAASIHLAFRVPPADVDQCYREIQQYAVEIIEPPTDKSWGHRTLFFKDPEANIIEIYAEI